MPFREAFPIIQADDVDRLAAFYVAAFGFEVGYRWPAKGPLEFAFLRLAPLGIGIGRRPHGERDEDLARRAPDRRGFTLWIYTDDVDSAAERVVAHGARLIEPPSDEEWGERIAFVADPEGNGVYIGAAAVESAPHER